MDNFEFYKELYHKENERRQEVLNAFNIPIVIITALTTAIYFATTGFNYSIGGLWTYFFIMLSFVSLGCLLFAIYYLIRAFIDFKKGYEYTGLPYTKELFDWHKQLDEHYASNNGTKEDSDKYFKNYLIESLVNHVDHNMFVNDQKHRFIFQSKRLLVMGLVLTLLSLIPFGYNFFSSPEKIQKFELVNSEIKSLNSKIDSLIEQAKKISHEQKYDNPTSTPTPTKSN